MVRHLRKGIHWVHIAHQKGKRKVRVDSRGKWHFMKGVRGGSRKAKRGHCGRHWVPGHYSR